ncbi:MAG: hypothetical protein V5A55_14045 [Halovenus sp.]
MSRASPFSLDSIGEQDIINKPLRALELPVRFAGFWTAVVVPFVVLGLFASGAAQQSPRLVVGLLVANVAGLVVGKDYNR